MLIEKLARSDSISARQMLVAEFCNTFGSKAAILCLSRHVPEVPTVLQKSVEAHGERDSIFRARFATAVLPGSGTAGLGHVPRSRDVRAWSVQLRMADIRIVPDQDRSVPKHRSRQWRRIASESILDRASIAYRCPFND